jgi:hypothetical protein
MPIYVFGGRPNHFLPHADDEPNLSKILEKIKINRKLLFFLNPFHRFI